MSTISEFMTHDHRACDEEFAHMENAVADENWSEANVKFEKFVNDLMHHLDMEEKVMFPTFESRSPMGGGCGPTQVMRMEHDQMRAIVNDMKTQLNAKNKDGFFGASETLMMLMQQHNMKEEQMLYPMTDNVMGGDGALLLEEMKGLERAS